MRRHCERFHRKNKQAKREAIPASTREVVVLEFWLSVASSLMLSGLLQKYHNDFLSEFPRNDAFYCMVDQAHTHDRY